MGYAGRGLLDSFAGHEYSEWIGQLSFIRQNGRSGCRQEQDQMGIFSGRFRALFVAATVLNSAAVVASAASPSQYARLDYNLYIGSAFRHTAFIELFGDRPASTANFLQYVNQGKYTASMMHRLVTGTLLQGGGYYPQFVTDTDLSPVPAYLNSAARVDLDGNLSTPNPTIPNENANSDPHLNTRGTLAMWQPDGSSSGASSQWFFNLKNNTTFDAATQGKGPYAVFGRLLGDGIDYVDDMIDRMAIFNLNADTNNDNVRDPGPFYTSAQDGTPLFADTQLHALQIVKTEQIDYYGAGAATPATDGFLYVVGRNAVIDTGATFTGLQQMVIAPNRTLQTRENYSLAGILVNSGTLDPGLQIGKLVVSNYQQNFDGTLKMEIAGTTADTQYDRVVATGEARLTGKLDVDFVNGFTPTDGSTFTVLNSNNIIGVFTLFDLPQLTAGLGWKVIRTSTSYILSVGAGDYDRNGVVDTADYVLWRNSKGSSVAIGNLVGNGADGDRSGVIDDNDYLIWRSNLGAVRGITSGGAGSASGSRVPDPGTVVLAVCGFMALIGLGRRRA
jgi:cyclophilin family peptidyl-prolyl cis-trans isomerase